MPIIFDLGTALAPYKSSPKLLRLATDNSCGCSLRDLGQSSANDCICDFSKPKRVGHSQSHLLIQYVNALWIA
mgnify:CR=1 FL=1